MGQQGFTAHEKLYRRHIYDAKNHLIYIFVVVKNYVMKHSGCK